MLTSILAIVLAALIGYAIVANLLSLAGKNELARGLVYTSAFLTGMILPYIAINGLLSMLGLDDQTA